MSERCYICNEPLDGPGKSICSASHTTSELPAPDCSLALPELKGELKDILGRMLYSTAGIARRLHDLKLYDVPRRAEEEQAAALHWMLNLYWKHGERWRVAGEKILKAEAPENS